jgi:membrane fusion protein (multidrug efflux system)
MTAAGKRLHSWVHGGSRAAIFAVFAIGVSVLLLWLAGKFAPKVPTSSPSDLATKIQAAGRVVPARIVRIPLIETAVGTIRPVHETAIGSKLLARVVEVHLKAGQPVKQGEVLVRLDSTDLRAKLKQAQATLESGEASRAQAEVDVDRLGKLRKANAVSEQDFERAATALKSADAELNRARASINEIQATLDWATIRSPLDGLVIDKKVDVGDMVTPGQTLATLLDPKRMQLVASVRESLAHRLRVGQTIDVQIENISKECSGTISEIVPESESASRAFQVKVTGPCPEGIYSGMFGRILIPLDQESVLMIPRAAVQSVGQLNLVDVVEKGAISRRAVRVGRSFGDDVEILSGLREGEQVELPPRSAEREASHG